MSNFGFFMIALAKMIFLAMVSIAFDLLVSSRVFRLECVYESRCGSLSFVPCPKLVFPNNLTISHRRQTMHVVDSDMRSHRHQSLGHNQA